MSTQHVFKMGPYEVELSAEQWQDVHAVFQNFRASPTVDDEFTITESDINGLVSEIIVSLKLAPATPF